jgi:hypothetical protein
VAQGRGRHDGVERGTPRGWVALIAALGAVALGAVVLAGCGSSYPPTGSSAGGRGTPSSPFGALTSSIEQTGTTLCDLNSINPNDQGGLAVIKVFSFSATGRCDSQSTAGQGVLYMLKYPWPDDAGYFLSLAEQNPRFSAGWQAGDIAVAVGGGTPPMTERRVARAIDGQADVAFPSS